MSNLAKLLLSKTERKLLSIQRRDFVLPLKPEYKTEATKVSSEDSDRARF